SAGSDQSSIYRNRFDAAQPSTNWFVEIQDNTWCTRVYSDGGSYINDDTPVMNGSYSTQADLNNDGFQDIMYAIDNGSGARLVVWLNMTDSGSTSFEFYDIGQYVLSTPTARNVGCFQWSGVVAWDADNDGDLDVLYANSNGQCSAIQEDYFYENTLGYGPVPFSSAFNDALRHNLEVPFGHATNVRSGGVAFGDLNNDGWQDLYVVHEGGRDSLHMHRGTAGLNSSTYQTLTAANDPYGSNLNANGATFGDIDNDGDLDLFLCNGGRIYYNTTNNNWDGSRLRPSHLDQDGYRPPQGASAEHYLDVMVSGASAEALISTKDGIGSRVYVFHMTDPNDKNPSSYGPANLVGMREIDGGSGYGSQATQVQHFGLDPDLYGANPHLEHYAIKAIFMTGDTLWKWDVVPDSVEVRIPYNNNADTTYLAQTIEVSLLEVWNPPVSRIELNAVPADATIPAGGTVTYTGTVYTLDENMNEYPHPTYSELIEWSVNGPPENPGLSNAIGSSTVFTGTEAYATYTVTARIINPEDTTNVVTQTMQVTVEPGVAHHISIEATATQPTNTVHLRDDNPIGLVSFLQTDLDKDVYAISRDEYGNWIGPVNTPTWTSLSTTVVTVSSPDPANGLGRIHRETIESHSTKVVAAKSGMLPDSVDVSLDNVGYTQLRISRGSRNNPISNLTIRTDQSAVLLAEGLNTLGVWDEVFVTWDTSGISVQSLPSRAVSTWTVQPAASGSGTISITKGGIDTSISVTFLPGLPRRLVLYSPPPNADSLPTTVAEPVVAGETVDIQARIFDRNMEWLTAFQTPPGSERITWSITTTGSFDPSAYLSAASGAQVAFTPTAAYHSYTIAAAITEGANTYTDAVTFSVIAAAPDTLVIEQSPSQAASPNAPAPYNPVVFQRNENRHDGVYAVLRDRFGNYHSTSTATRWASSDTGIVTTENGVSSLGQGIVHRVADSGQTTISATDTSVAYGSLNLTGFTVVQLLDVTYDSLRIMIDRDGRFVDITDLTMRTDQDTTLLAFGLRSSDSTWVQIPVNWSATGVSLAPAPQGGVEEYRFSPNAVGSGVISISLAGESDQVNVTFVPGLPRSVALYPETGDPVVNALAPYADTLLTAKAGVDFPLIAKVFDHNGVWLAEYETGTHAAEFSWDIIDEPGVSVPTGSLTGSGFANAFLATEAFRTVQVVVTFSRPGDVPRGDTVNIQVVAGDPHHVVIEASAEAADVSPNDDAPVDTVTISPNDTIAFVYAIIRDQYGNYVANSQSTDWSSTDTGLVSATEVFASLGGGRLFREGDSGTVVIAATGLEQIGLTDASDDVIVRVVRYTYTALRIVTGDGTPIGSLTMTTNDDTTLAVEGRRSDNGQWEPINADWDLTGGLTTNPPPSTGRTFTFSPTAPGAGSIIVSTESALTTPDTLPVTFLVGAPVRATFTIVTPHDDRRAGEPIQAIVRIYNENGLVPGEWCFDSSQSAIYSDSMGDGGKTPPVISIDGNDTTLNVNGGSDILTPQCFQDGIGTVTVTLYHAPSSDSLHRLNVTLGDITASTAPFGLGPGDLAYIDIVDGNWASVTEPVVLVAPDGATVLISKGFDQWGNPRGNEPSDWSVSYAAEGGLHAVTRPDSVWRIYYESSGVVSDEQGWIRAVAPTDLSIRDSVYVQIAGPPARFTYAVTQDTNANGYLDGMVLHFSEEVTLPSDSTALQAVLDNMSFDYYGAAFTPTAIIGANGTMTDSVFMVTFEELQNGEPQTGWTPEVSWSGVPGVTDVFRAPSEDRAGPVIWEVVKTVSSDATPRVEVVLSEKVQDSSGSSLVGSVGSLRVDDLFNVYYRIPGTEQYVLQDSLLNNITLSDVIGDSVIVFYMSNGNDLVPGYYMDLRMQVDSSGMTTDTTFVLTDRSLSLSGTNAPLPDNRKTIVREQGDIKLTVLPIPNPTRPSEEIEPAPNFTATHSEEAKNAIQSRTLRGGSAAKVDLLVPSSGTIRVRRKIYDMVGNLVRSAESSDLIQDYCDETNTSRDLLPSIIHVYFYWNGFNDDGLPVAPGAYREVTLFDFTSPEKKDQRVLTTYGIVR
ncbi:MAG: hypothetical protein GF331_24305, partial [Chitinivibrionales bacterium]|nr:hypothetical protein [Chitinivibrionales bacterium]